MATVISEPFGNPVITDTPLIARLIKGDDPHEAAAYQCLRYEYFVRQKGWITPDPTHPARETDRYDVHSWHLAVSQNHHAHSEFDSLILMPAPAVTRGLSPQQAADLHILTYIRAIPWTAPCGFMLDHEFKRLLSDEEHASLRRANAVELSRLVIAPSACTKSSIHSGNGQRPPHIIELLLKLLYHLSLEQQIEHYYIVVEKNWLPAFTRRFHIPFKVIGREYTFPDGTVTVAAHATRTELEQAVAAKDPEKYLWYQQREPSSS